MGWGKDEKFECYVGSLKNPIFRGEGHKKTIYRVRWGGEGGGVHSTGENIPLCGIAVCNLLIFSWCTAIFQLNFEALIQVSIETF